MCESHLAIAGMQDSEALVGQQQVASASVAGVQVHGDEPRIRQALDDWQQVVDTVRGRAGSRIVLSKHVDDAISRVRGKFALDADSPAGGDGE